MFHTSSQTFGASSSSNSAKIDLPVAVNVRRSMRRVDFIAGQRGGRAPLGKSRGRGAASKFESVLARLFRIAAAATKVARAFQPVIFVRKLASAFTRWKARATPKSSQT